MKNPSRVWGELPAAEAVGDEAAPGLGGALESEQGLGSESREDLHRCIVVGAGYSDFGALDIGAFHSMPL